MSDHYVVNGVTYDWTGCHAFTKKSKFTAQCQHQQGNLVPIEDGRRICGVHFNQREKGEELHLIPLKPHDPRLTQFHVDELVSNIRGVHRASDVLPKIEREGGRVSQAYANKENSQPEGEQTMTKHLYIVSFTGHRPQTEAQMKLSGRVKVGGFTKNNRGLKVKWAMVEGGERALTKANELGVELGFVWGGALGVDQWGAQVANKLECPHVAFLPLEGFNSRWPKTSSEFLVSLLETTSKDLADRLVEERKFTFHKRDEKYPGVFWISPHGYTHHKMQVRNQAMVDVSDAVIAVFDGSEGGTANCVGYARNRKVPIYRINPDELPKKENK